MELGNTKLKYDQSVKGITRLTLLFVMPEPTLGMDTHLRPLSDSDIWYVNGDFKYNEHTNMVYQGVLSRRIPQFNIIFPTPNKEIESSSYIYYLAFISYDGDAKLLKRLLDCLNRWKEYLYAMLEIELEEEWILPLQYELYCLNYVYRLLNLKEEAIAIKDKTKQLGININNLNKKYHERHS